MSNHPRTNRIYLIRHATPDWQQKDIPYDIAPGPNLVQQGKREAAQAGVFLAAQGGIAKIYTSPLARAKQTAEIIAGIANLPVEIEEGIAEWRHDEDETQFSAHFLPVWSRVVGDSKISGAIALVTHGGPIRLVLQTLGLSVDLLETYRNKYDNRNPLPPAGIWLSEKLPEASQWSLNIVFTPATPIPNQQDLL